MRRPCREYGIPCVVGTSVATLRIKTGDIIEVDGTKGTVTILERAQRLTHTVTRHGKRIVVTGGARGIGAELAAELRARGAEVVTPDISDGADVRCDVCDETAVDTAFDEIGGSHRRAGEQRRADRHPQDPRPDPARRVGPDVRRQRQGHVPVLRGPSVRHMNDGGSIVNVASETAFTGSQGFVHYVASKGAVVSLTRALANELGVRNIRVNCVAPGLHDHARFGASRSATTRRAPRSGG